MSPELSRMANASPCFRLRSGRSTSDVLASKSCSDQTFGAAGTSMLGAGMRAGFVMKSPWWPRRAGSVLEVNSVARLCREQDGDALGRSDLSGRSDAVERRDVR